MKRMMIIQLFPGERISREMAAVAQQLGYIAGWRIQSEKQQFP